MSGASGFNNLTADRKLREDERELIRFLLSGKYPTTSLENVLVTSRVRDMQDGGMGSIQFVRPEPQTLGKALVEAQYHDSDGVLVVITINSDKNRELFEVDLWKVDFFPLRRYPRPSDLFSVKTINA
jgi:hypothetical protein